RLVLSPLGAGATWTGTGGTPVAGCCTTGIPRDTRPRYRRCAVRGPLATRRGSGSVGEPSGAPGRVELRVLGVGRGECPQEAVADEGDAALGAVVAVTLEVCGHVVP